MKKRTVLLIALLILVLGPTRTLAQAQTGRQPLAQTTPTPAPPNAPGVPQGDEISLSLLGYTEETLFGPYDTFTYVFSLPSNWQLSGDARLDLAFNVYVSEMTTTEEAQATPAPWVVDGSLEIFVNDQFIEAIPLNQSGEHTATVQVPLAALQAIPPGESHQLTFELTAGGSCDVFDQHTRVAIHPYTKLIFPHTLTEPVLNLALLPRPIYQNAFVPDQALLVVPDQPTAEELSAAMDVAAAFGGMSNGKLALQLRTNSAVTPEERETHHLIFVGKPEGLSLLQQVQGLPAGASAEAFAQAGAQAGDGVVQMAASPWNPAFVVLVVSGRDDSGVVKAAQAVSTGEVLPTGQPNLALVAEVRPQGPQQVPQGIDHTLEELGYGDRKLWRVGFSATEYRFFIPPGKHLGPEAYLDLVISHSKLLNYDLSGLIIQLNGKDIGSVKFDDTNADYSRIHIPLPEAVVITGYNKLRINAQLVPNDPCVDPRLGATWVRIWPETTLHLPLVEGTLFETPTIRFDLGRFPVPFSLDPLLETTALIVPQGDAVAWDVAAQIAYYLGERVDPAQARLVVHYADAVPEETRTSRHLLLVGVPSTLPLLKEVNGTLPAPVDWQTNRATLKALPVEYRFPPEAPLGFVELVTSPWNKDRVLIAALGSTADGVRAAGQALTDPTLRAALSGDFALVVEGRVLSSESRTSTLYALPAIQQTPEAEASTLPQPTAPIQRRPLWVLPALGVSLLAMLLVIAYVLWRTLARQRQREEPWGRVAEIEHPTEEE